MSVRTEARPPASGRREQLTVWGLTVSLLVLVLLPSASFGWFSGVPVTSAPAYFGLVWVLVPLSLSGAVRRRFIGITRCAGSRSFRAVVALMLVALAAKLVLLAGAPIGGFSACFHSQVPVGQQTGAVELALPSSRCELSYSNPLGRFGGATRIDSAIDYGASVGGGDWGLDFFNSTRFNYWAQWAGVPNRQYLPFATTWTGQITNARRRQLTVRYVGQGSVSVDGSTTRLTASYGRISVVPVSVPAGRHHLSVRFAFTHEVIQPQQPTAPYAGVALRDQSGSPIRAAPVPSGWRILAAVADVVIAALLTLVLASVVLATRGRVLAALLFGAAAVVAIRLPHADVFIGLLEFSTFLLAAWWVVRRRATLTAGLLTIYASVLTIELERARHELTAFGHVLIRTGGDDWLTYESQAHVVLAGSLRGGEGVFEYAASMRYLVALGHAIFGNGDGRLSVVVLAAIVSSFLAFALLTTARARWGPAPRWEAIRRRSLADAGVRRLLPGTLMLLAVLAGTLLLSNGHSVAFTRDPLSEPATWALIPVACILFLSVRSRWAFVTGAAVCALVLVTRVDQGVGLVAIIGCGAVALLRGPRTGRLSPRRFRPTAAAALAVFLVIALLPAAHNLYYGNRFRLVVDPGPGPVNYAMPVADLPRICCSSSVRSKFAHQVKFVVVPGSASDPFVLTVRLVQVLWLAVLLLTARRWRRLSTLTRLVALLPAAFVLPQLFLNVDSYYPRHVIADYLVMSLAAIYVFAELQGPGTRRPTAPPARCPRHDSPVGELRP